MRGSPVSNVYRPTENPLIQIKKFAFQKAPYIKLTALTNTEGTDLTGYAEVNIITEP